MNTTQRVVSGLALAAGLAAASAPALAQHRNFHGHGPRVHFGVVIGAPIYPRWYYPAPRYYYPPAVVMQAQPPMYIEQEQQPSATVPPETAYSADAASYWYFCRDSNTYYPYVKSCAGQWERVTPQSPPG